MIICFFPFNLLMWPITLPGRKKRGCCFDSVFKYPLLPRKTFLLGGEFWGLIPFTSCHASKCHHYVGGPFLSFKPNRKCSFLFGEVQRWPWSNSTPCTSFCSLWLECHPFPHCPLGELLILNTQLVRKFWKP